MAGVRRCGDEGRELVNAFLAADLGELPPLVELVGDGDRVDGLTLLVELERGSVDTRVRLAVEVAGIERVARRFDRRLRQHHRAENGLLGVEILRWKGGHHLSGRDHHRGVNSADDDPATLWKSAQGAPRRALFAGAMERMFAQSAGGLWTNTHARSENFGM